MNTYKRHRFPPGILSQLPGATVEAFQPGSVEGCLVDAATCISTKFAPLGAPSKFTGRLAAGNCVSGVIGGKKLQLHPTNLSYLTPVVWWKGLGEVLAGDELIVSFRQSLRCTSRG